MLQFVSLPLAARLLGREEFGIYATISMAVFMVAVLELGIGPALARGISEASARGDREREGQLYVSGTLLLAGLAVIATLLAAIVLTVVPVPVLFGEKYEPFVETMLPALWLGVGLMIGNLAVELIDRVREGYMEAGIVNAWGTVGNILGAIIILIGVRQNPTVTFLLLAVFAPNIMVRLLSTTLLLYKRPWLIGRKARPDRATMVLLVRDGLSFSATSFVVYLVDYTICAMIVGRYAGPSEVALFHVMMSITTAFAGMLIMVGRPMWAAVVDAMEAGDMDWLTRAARSYHRYLVALTASASVFLIAAGPWLVQTVYGAEFEVGRLLFVGHACFLFANGWRQVNRYLLIGMGSLPLTVIPILAGLAVGLVMGVVGLVWAGLGAMFAGMALGTFCISGPQLHRLVHAKIKESKPAVPQSQTLNFV